MTGPADGYRALVFDLDGTIIDSAPAMQAIASAFLAAHDRGPLSLEETRAFIGEGARVFCRRTLLARDLSADEDVFEERYAEFHAHYAAGSPHDNVPYPGAVETLEALGEAGYAMALCTNKPAIPTWNVLDAMELGAFFKSVVTGDTLPRVKPDPAPLTKAIADLGATPATTLFVGDSEVDAKTAAAAGVDFAFHTPGYARDRSAVVAAYRFENWRDLMDIVCGAGLRRPA